VSVGPGDRIPARFQLCYSQPLPLSGVSVTAVIRHVLNLIRMPVPGPKPAATIAVEPSVLPASVAEYGVVVVQVESVLTHRRQPCRTHDAGRHAGSVGARWRGRLAACPPDDLVLTQSGDRPRMRIEPACWSVEMAAPALSGSVVFFPWLFAERIALPGLLVERAL
jgi:hypothetical protein